LIIAAPASPSPPKRGANNPRLLDNYLTKKDFIFDGVKVGFEVENRGVPQDPQIGLQS
jgi:hypothetical protein